MSIASWTSPPASALTLPISRVIRSVSAAFSRSSTWAKRKRISPRLGAGTSRQSSKAACAVSTARSTAAASASGTLPRTSPVAGLVLSRALVAVAIETEGTGCRDLAACRVAARESAPMATADLWARRLDLWNGDLALADEIVHEGIEIHRYPPPPISVAGRAGLVEWRVLAERRPARPAAAGRRRAVRLTYLLGRVGVRERPRDARAPPVARLQLLAELGRRLARATVGPLTAVDDHRHVRVVLVVLDHLVVELVGELTRDHAIDHPFLIVGRRSERARGAAASYRRAISGTSRPSSSTCAFHALNVSSSSSSSWPRRSSRTGCADSGLTRYWYHDRSHATVTASSPASPESGTMLARASPRLFAMPPTVRR